MPACLCGCGRFATQRGRAKTCMEKLRQEIKAGKTTEEEAIKTGRVLPPKRSSWMDYPRHG